MSFTKQQLIELAKLQAYKPVKAAKAQQAKAGRSRKGYCKPLPISPLTPRASQSRWALLAKGTESSHNRACDPNDARPKAQLGDRRLMRDTANINPEDVLYSVPTGLDVVGIFCEFLRVRKVRHDREAATALETTLNSKEHKAIKLAIRHNDWTKVTQVIEACIVRNQVRI